MLPNVANQRINIDVLDGLSVLVMFPIHATAPEGLPNIDPVCRPITSPAELLCLNEGLQHQRSVAIAMLPVSGKLPCTLRQNLAGESCDAQPSRSVRSKLQEIAEYAGPRTCTPKAVPGDSPPGWKGHLTAYYSTSC